MTIMTAIIIVTIILKNDKYGKTTIKHSFSV